VVGKSMAMSDVDLSRGSDRLSEAVKVCCISHRSSCRCGIEIP
jgi:hypothetical protein